MNRRRRHTDAPSGAEFLSAGGAALSSGAVPATKTTILIADEEEALRALEVACFERLGCIVRPASSLKQALAAARDGIFDVALISEGILGADCMEACASLREASGRQRLPIVLLSDAEMPEVFDADGAGGCSDFVPRSASQIDLVRRVANLLQIPPRRGLRTMVALAGPETRRKAEYLGHSRDISRTGILIETNRQLALEEQLPIKFLLPHGSSLVNALSVVTRVVRNTNSGRYEIGCRFLDIDNASQERIENYLHEDITLF
jgi:CheY-like chemotaxis protein